MTRTRLLRDEDRERALERERVRVAIEATQAGDVEAFATIVSTFEARLLAYVRSRCADLARAEDIAQAALVAAYEGLARFDSRRDFGAWLFGIAANLVRKSWRQLGNERRGLAALGELTRQAIGQWAASKSDRQRASDRLEALRGCLEELPPRGRALVAEHYDQGRSLRSIARDRERAPSTLRVMLHRLRDTLRGCIERRLARSER